MGVPRFFQHILKVYPESCRQITFNTTQFPEKVDGLYIDANGIIHNCARALFFEKTKRLCPRNKAPPPKPTFADVYQKICEYIDQLVKYVRPSRLLYVAIDGTAPLAKQAQQRQRRYRGAYEKTQKEFDTFDTCMITPGTEFLEGLSKYMHGYFKTQAKAWKICVTFSDASVPGEGEHNCIDSIRDNPDPNFVHCIYGLDADLFMLTLATHRERMFLLREDIFTQKWGDTVFYICDIHKLRDGLMNKWGGTAPAHCGSSNTRGNTTSSNVDSSNRRNGLIDDFVFICFLVGNDFLHIAPCLHDLHSNLLMMLEVRESIVGRDAPVSEYLTDGANVNFSVVTKWLTEIAKSETALLSEQWFIPTPFPRVTLSKALIDPMEPEKGVNLAKYRKAYYAKAGITDQSQVPAFCRAYLEGLEWVQWYYHKPPLNWRWSYKYHYTPLLSDLAGYLTHVRTVPRVSQTPTAPNTPFQQLLGVIPPRSARILPDALQHVYVDSDLEEYYPTTFKIDQEGKGKEWEGTVLLPFIDFEKILRFWQNLDAPIRTALDKHPRNQFGSIARY